MTIIHVCSFVQATGELRIEAQSRGPRPRPARVIPFEFHEMFGPTWLQRNGDPLKNQTVSARVWEAFEAWQATTKWARKPEKS
jgi:hypothetical protein